MYVSLMLSVTVSHGFYNDVRLLPIWISGLIAPLVLGP